MAKLKTIKIILLLLILSASFPIFAEKQQGPYVSLNVSPIGIGSLRMPMMTEPVGTATTKSANTFTDFSNYKLSAGYFYDRLQGEAYFSKSYADNQTIDHSNAPPDTISSNSTFFGANLGYRMSNPGYPSYNFMYIGIRRMSFSANYQGVEVTGLGYLAGYRGLFTFFTKHNFELAVLIEAYVGRYVSSDFKSDLDLNAKSKKDSLIAGGSFGVGTHYEPYNLTFLLKVSPEIDQITHKVTYQGADVNMGVKHQAINFGFEVTYQYLNFKHND